MQQADNGKVCGLCGRVVPEEMTSLHHLKPRQKGGRSEHRTILCIPCHKQLHATFSNTELAKRLDTLEKLRAAPELQAFLRWVRRQPPHRKVRTYMSGTHPHRRRRG